MTCSISLAPGCSPGSDDHYRIAERVARTQRSIEMKMRLETTAVHAGHGVDTSSGAVAMPITLSTTFERDPEGLYPRGYFLVRLWESIA